MSEQPDRPVIAIQIGAVSFVDEGIEPVLDILQDRGRVNNLFLATPTWTRGTGGRADPRPSDFPDHGGAGVRPRLGRRQLRHHPSGVLPQHHPGPGGRAPDYDVDLFDDVIAEAKKRGMASYAWMEESSYTQALRDYPELAADAWRSTSGAGRRRARASTIPTTATGTSASSRTTCKSYDLDGLAWCSERPGPLNMTAAADRRRPTWSPASARTAARSAGTAGIDPERARPATANCWTGTKIARRRPAEPTARSSASGGSCCAIRRSLAGRTCGPRASVSSIATSTASPRPADRGPGRLARLPRDLVQPVLSGRPGLRRAERAVRLHQGGRVQQLRRPTLPPAGSALISQVPVRRCRAGAVYPLCCGPARTGRGRLDRPPPAGFTAEYVKRETARAVAGVGTAARSCRGSTSTSRSALAAAAVPTGRSATRAHRLGLNADNSPPAPTSPSAPGRASGTPSWPPSTAAPTASCSAASTPRCDWRTSPVPATP